MFRVKVLLSFLLVFLSWVNADPEVTACASATSVKKPKCSQNEVFNSCKYSCPPDSCATLYAEFLCAAEQKCEPGCVCAQGYLRNSTGVCVPQDRCLPPACENDPNAIRGCGDRCKKTCKDYKDTEKKCLHTACSLYGCDCRDGYVYDENQDKCVKPEDCSPQCSGENERYDTCSNGNCSPQSCDDLGFPIACRKVSKCEGGCLCKEGFVRNKKGVCVPNDQCPSCGGDKNAVSGCGINCGKKCEDRNRTEPAICPAICLNNGCDCRQNFYYDSEKKKCVAPKDCPAPVPQCSGQNERFDNCSNAICSPKTCNDVGGPIACPSVTKCIGGCVCQEGFVRNKDGVCIDQNQCPGKQCKGQNERYDNCSNGSCSPKSCDDLGYPIACPAVSKCEGGCLCKEGYVRNKKGVCISQDQCPSCGGDPNAISGCGINCGKKCADRNRTGPAICPAVCMVNGCDCRPNFFYDTQKKRCVKPNECPPPPPQCSGKNEEYNNCVNGNCSPKSCDELGYPIACPDVDKCEGGCLCKQGYVRNKNGVCIPQNQCPSCGGDPNAISGCGIYCGRKCEDRNRTDPIACPAICMVNGCDCRPDFFYNTKEKRCVKPNECPAPPPQCSGKNEEYNNCVNGNCSPKSCDDLGYPIACPDVEKCEGGCLCKEGYVRNKKGVCIPQNQCPSCGGDLNAVSGCGIYCGTKCEDRNRTGPIACPASCLYNGCDCRPNFFYDSQKNRCVKPNECPGGTNEQKCKDPNAQYVNCAVDCPNDYCPTNDGPQPVCDPPYPCPPGCRCKVNYLKAKNGTCILAETCPPVKCTRRNEVWATCPECIAEDCSNKDDPPVTCNTLLRNCQPKCVCKKNTFRNNDAICVPRNECPK